MENSTSKNIHYKKKDILVMKSAREFKWFLEILKSLSPLKEIALIPSSLLIHKKHNMHYLNIFKKIGWVVLTAYYVYMILCRDGSYYTGYTSNLDERMKLHMNGKAARYTKMHKPQKLVYTEKCESRAEAMKREKAIKKLSHNEKHKLFTSRWND